MSRAFPSEQKNDDMNSVPWCYDCCGKVLHKLSEVVTLAMFGVGLGFSLCAAPSRSHCIPNFRGVRFDGSLGEILVNFLTIELLIYIHIIY